MNVQPIEWRGLVPRDEWPPGPWDDEPDKAQWSDQATGLPCLVVRSHSGGAWCGYVGLRPGHPWRMVKRIEDIDVDVHGGLTYGPAPCADLICHITRDEDDVEWIGFDCGHAEDASPYDFGRRRSWGGTYRTLAFVRAEIAKLAKFVDEAGR